MSARTMTISTDDLVQAYASVGRASEAGLRAAYHFGLYCDALSERHSFQDLGSAIGRTHAVPRLYAKLYLAWENNGGVEALVNTARDLDCYDVAKLAGHLSTAPAHMRLVPHCTSCGSYSVNKERMPAEQAEEILAQVEAARNGGKAPAKAAARAQ
jgi:hypothetical protein